MNRTIEIECSDGIITDEHLEALKVGEVLPINDVKELRFSNVYLDSQLFNPNKN